MIRKRPFRLIMIMILNMILLCAPTFRAQAPSGASSAADPGIELYKSGKFAEAAKVLSGAVKKDPNQPDAWHFLGLSQYKLGKLKDARKAFEAAAKLRPDYIPTRVSLGYIHLFTGNVPGADNEARYVLSVESSNPDAHCIAGRISLGRDEPVEALKEADLSLAGNDKFAPGLLLRSQALVNLFAKAQTDRAYRANAESLGIPTNRYQLLKGASESLERYLAMNTELADRDVWREQRETLRFYAEKADADSPPTIGTPGITPVRILKKEKAGYTADARNKGIQGVVVLQVVFDVDGTIKHILILKGLSDGLTQSALQAMRGIKFTPATRNGVPVTVIGRMEFTFKLH